MVRMRVWVGWWLIYGGSLYIAFEARTYIVYLHSEIPGYAYELLTPDKLLK